jgi:DOPA 4,5-dioxygenase
MRNISEIREFHAHVSFDPDTPDAAERIHATLARDPAVGVGRVRERPIGPHPKGMFQVAFGHDRFAEIVSWLC